MSNRCPITGRPFGPGGRPCEYCDAITGLAKSVMVFSSGKRHTLDLDVELHWPRPNRHEGARGRVLRKISRVNFVDGGIETGVARVHATHHDLFQRGAREFETVFAIFRITSDKTGTSMISFGMAPP